MLVARLARQMLDLDRQIKPTDKPITSRFRTHPRAAIIESLPGGGPNLGAEFMVATDGTLGGFADAGRLASYAGPVPVAQDSGRVTGNLRRPKRYSHRLPRLFYMPASSSIRAPGSSRTFYDRERYEQLIHIQALLALALAWSTSSGHCCATAAHSHQPRPNPLPRRLDTVIQIPFVGAGQETGRQRRPQPGGTGAR